jgi:ribosomal protein L37E
MPLYAFRCKSAHEQEWLGRFDARPAFLPCSCGEVAFPAPALTSPGIVRGGTDGGKGEAPRSREGFVEESPGVWVKGKALDLSLVAWACESCGKKGWDDAMPGTCPACSSASVKLRDVEWTREWWEAEGFSSSGGYYDRGAGRWFSSKAERRKWADENGMVEIAGVNDDTDKAVRKESERQDAMLEFWRQELRERDADPEYRAARDRGLVPDDAWLRAEVGYEG